MLKTPNIANTPLQTKYGKFVLYVFSWSENEQDNVLVLVSKSLAKCPLVRIQSACYTGEIFESVDCDCHWQLETSLQQIQQKGGAFVYMLRDGRGAGLLTKIRGMKISHDEKLDTADAYEKLGVPLDPRDYSQAIFVLKHLGVRKLRLLTNNPRKVAALEDEGLVVIRERHESEPTKYNQEYLRAKAIKLGHLLDFSNAKNP